MLDKDHVHALPPGARLYEYVIERVLGHGAFGITYLARDENLNAPVAIKEYLPDEFAARDTRSTVVPKSVSTKQDYAWGLERFHDEAQTLARFHHRNIVRVLRLLRANGTAYIVMPYERGRSLADYLQMLGRTLTDRELLGLALPLMDGLAAVHKEGFLHRDIKPGNIFIRQNGEPVLLDFGSARVAVGSKSRNITAILTPGYAPIEQYANAASQGPWTDIYGLGAVLYRCISGRTPVDATARSQARLNSEPDPLTAAVEAGRDRYPQPLLAAIDQSLQIAAKDRPQSIADWRPALLAARRQANKRPGRPVEGRVTPVNGGERPPRTERTERPSQGRRPPDQRSGRPPPPSSPAATRRPPRRTGRRIAWGLAILALLGGLGFAGYLASDGRMPWQAQGNGEPEPVSAAEPGPAAQPASGSEPDTETVRRQVTVPAAVPAARLPLNLDAGIVPSGATVRVESLPSGGPVAAGGRPLRSGQRIDGRLDDLTMEPRHAAEGPAGALVLLVTGDDTRTEVVVDIQVAPHQCDVLAADPEDGSAPTRGVALDRIDAERADAACRAAVDDYPEVARFQYQLGRALTAAGDHEAAMEYYLAAAERGSAPARAAAGAAGAATDGPDDPAERVRWLRQRAEQGDAEAQTELGQMYKEGRGIPRDYGLAARWLRRAARQGNVDAQIDLGLMEREGLGMPADPAAAAEWFQRAADQGDAWALTELGIMYHDGTGVPQDFRRARALFARAANQGYPWAKINIGLMHSHGSGQRPDPHQAALWFARGAAAAQADGDAYAVDVARGYLDDLGRTAWIDAAETLLNDAGYDPGRISGAVSMRARRAIRQFQRDAGLEVDGRITPDLLIALAERTS
jgi:serine/threonine protein kinase/TPR repeat protein